MAISQELLNITEVSLVEHLRLKLSIIEDKNKNITVAVLEILILSSGIWLKTSQTKDPWHPKNPSRQFGKLLKQLFNEKNLRKC